MDLRHIGWWLTQLDLVTDKVKGKEDVKNHQQVSGSSNWLNRDAIVKMWKNRGKIDVARISRLQFWPC